MFELYSGFGISLLSTIYDIFRFMELYTNDIFDYISITLSLSGQIFFIVMACKMRKDYEWRTAMKVGTKKEFTSTFQQIVLILELYNHYLLFMCCLRLFIMFGLINCISSGRGIFNGFPEILVDLAEAIVLISLGILGYYAV